MKPAWPIENWPVNPFTRFNETASTMLMPISISTWKWYGFNARGSSRLSATSASSVSTGPTRRLISNLLRHGAAEDARGAHEQDDDEQDERDRVAVRGREVAGHHHLGHAHDQPAHDRARDVADAAQHRGHERLQPGQDAHVGLDSGRLERHQHPGG